MALGPFFRKIRMTWAQALWYCNSRRDNEDGDQVTTGRGAYTTWINWTNGWFQSWGGWGRTVQDFITLLRTVCDLKLTKCYFCNFPLNVFRLWLILGNWNCGKWNHGYGKECCIKLVLSFMPKSSGPVLL